MIDRTFIDELASKAPTPGGGGACAYCGALAAALSSMVCNLTRGKAAYAEVESDIEGALTQLSALQESLIDLIERDADAFEPLARAYAMPKETSEQQAAKDEALQNALVAACEVPLSIMEACARVVQITETVAHEGSRLALSDAGVAALFARAALQGASLNVLINCQTMNDRERAERYLTQSAGLIVGYCDRAEEVYDYVVRELG